MDKKQLVEAVLLTVRRELETAVEAQKDAQMGATHEEAKPENDKDTRAVEASYLARGQAQRVADLERALTLLEGLGVVEFTADMPIRLGAAALLDDGNKRSWYFLSPAGAGSTVTVDGTPVRIISTQSPLGCQLVGLAVNDDFEVETPQGTREYDICEVR